MFILFPVQDVSTDVNHVEDGKEHLSNDADVFTEGQEAEEQRVRSGSVLQKVETTTDVRIEEGSVV